jgi:integrase
MPEYKFKRKDLTSLEEVRSMIARARWDWLKALIAFLYLYGCRISEALKLQRRNVWIEDEYLVAQIGVLKRRSGKGPYENVPHLIHVSTDAPFVKDVIIPYLERIRDPDAKLFPRTRQLVWTRLKELNPLVSPHVFRHDRLMKLALAGASEAQLMDWAGWTDPRPAGNYIRSTGRLAQELAEKVY